MIDTHYDLLTILYHCYMRNDFSYIDQVKNDFKEIKGVIANLYFMNQEEMKQELGTSDFSTFEMFKVSTNLFREYFKSQKVIFSIEGCDYIEDEKQLEELYQLGLRSILLVWNNENKYGSGNKTDKGLTELGKKFIKKAIELGIIIDLSHMNKNTFWDTIQLLKEEKSSGKRLKVIASHSNCYNICNHKRNLDDEQILAIKELDGMIGLVSYGPFISKKQDNLELKFLDHIKHLEKLIGIDRMMLSTDNMDFATVLFNEEEEISVLKHKDIVNKIKSILKSDYTKEQIEKVLYKNAEKLF